MYLAHIIKSEGYILCDVNLLQSKFRKLCTFNIIFLNNFLPLLIKTESTTMEIKTKWNRYYFFFIVIACVFQLILTWRILKFEKLFKLSSYPKRSARFIFFFPWNIQFETILFYFLIVQYAHRWFFFIISWIKWLKIIQKITPCRLNWRYFISYSLIIFFQIFA